jgi:hypothetical protein
MRGRGFDQNSKTATVGLFLDHPYEEENSIKTGPKHPPEQAGLLSCREAVEESTSTAQPEPTPAVARFSRLLSVVEWWQRTGITSLVHRKPWRLKTPRSIPLSYRTEPPAATREHTEFVTGRLLVPRTLI